jgi:hypothetical protein
VKVAVEPRDVKQLAECAGSDIKHFLVSHGICELEEAYKIGQEIAREIEAQIWRSLGVD